MIYKQQKVKPISQTSRKMKSKNEKNPGKKTTINFDGFW